MRIADYAEAIRTSILTTPHVLSHSLTYEDRPPTAGVIRGRILFSDGSLLHLREYVLISDSIVRLKYAYHYVAETQALVFRYDNALDPAAKHLPTYPHHKHLPHSLEPSPAPSLEAVLNEAARSIRHA